MVTNSNYIKLKHAEITHYQENIYVLTFEDDYEVELEDAIEIDKAFIKITNNTKFSVIVDARDKFSSITNDARNFFANDPEIIPIREKIAIVVNNMPTKILANFFMRFNRPQTPTKVFNNLEEAVKWLSNN
jgi:hypothetical protein